MNDKKEQVIDVLNGIEQFLYKKKRIADAGFVHIAISLIKEQPQIVRCKDCRYSKDWNVNMIKCLKTENGSTMFHNKNWFCAYGEPKDSY